MEYIALFLGVRELIKADKICQKEGVAVKVIPIPHQYTSECGMALIVNEDAIENFKSIVSKNNITFEVHKYEKK